jgi:uncharacterized protein YjlB
MTPSRRRIPASHPRGCGTIRAALHFILSARGRIKRKAYFAGNAMQVLEILKRSIDQVTDIGKRSSASLRRFLRQRRAHTALFRDDGAVPNNPKLPLVYYRSPVRLSDAADPAAVFEDLFESNGWRDSWRDSIYDYTHYHSATHEVLGVARGHARVRFGGRIGKVIELRAGDVAILPAGTGHQRLSASGDLLVVGAYPAGGRYDECRGSHKQHARARASIFRVPLPDKDPVYGAEGPLLDLWR